MQLNLSSLSLREGGGGIIVVDEDPIKIFLVLDSSRGSKSEHNGDPPEPYRPDLGQRNQKGDTHDWIHGVVAATTTIEWCFDLHSPATAITTARRCRSNHHATVTPEPRRRPDLSPICPPHHPLPSRSPTGGLGSPGSTLSIVGGGVGGGEVWRGAAPMSGASKVELGGDDMDQSQGNRRRRQDAVAT
jgi:hypothetical protein